MREGERGKKKKEKLHFFIYNKNEGGNMRIGDGSQTSKRASQKSPENAARAYFIHK
jgi:hypothetical protein